MLWLKDDLLQYTRLVNSNFFGSIFVKLKITIDFLKKSVIILVYGKNGDYTH